MAAIDRLIEDLRAEGSVDSEGRFTLDREQARAKMQKFQLVDARRYVLELVQAAVLRDATYVVFDIDADDMHMRFDGSPFVAAEIDDLYGSLFADGDSRPLRGVRQLALALNAALGMGPKYIHVRSGNVELRMIPGQPDAIITHEQAATRTEIHVRQRLRARVLLDFFLDLTGRMAEEQYLRKRCVYSSVPVTLEGKTLSFGLEGGEQGLASLAIAGRDFRGVLKVVEERHDSCELRLVKDGVWIDSRELAHCGSYLIVVVEGENLRKDVSQAKIVGDAALERIEAAVRRARWQLWRNASMQESPHQSRLRAMAEIQLLTRSSLRELKEIPEVIELSELVTWTDCRDPGRKVSLRELVQHKGVLQYAAKPYPGLACEGDPILLINNALALAQIERTLERSLVLADNLLEREHRRMLGRKAWLAREGEPELPTHLQFLLRAPIRFEIDAGPVRGEIGIDAELLKDPNGKAPSHLFMFKDGRLLGRTELELGFLNLWIALEGPFEPNDDYTDALRNSTFVQVLLRAVACLREPLGKLLANVYHYQTEAIYRGLIKRWLLVLVDVKAQIALLTLAGVDTTSRSLLGIEELLPGLLTADDSLATAPLFEQLAGMRLSLAQLAMLAESHATLRYVETRPDDPRLFEPHVLVAGPGDRKILRAVFGDERLEQWDLGPKLRELEFWASGRSELSAARRDAEARLRKAGVVELDSWLIELPPGPTKGFVLFFMHSPELSADALDSFKLSVRHDGRLLCDAPIGTRFGPLVAVVEHPGLKPSSSWDAVQHDAAFNEVLATVRAASRELFARAVAGLERCQGEPRRWLARVLLHGAAADPELFELAKDVPLLATVDAQSMTLGRARELVRSRKQLEYVGRDVGFVPIDDWILVAEGSELDDLRTLFGDVLVDIGSRVRHHQIHELLEGRPVMTEAKLDPATTLVRLPIRDNDQVGELGLSRERTEPGLVLELGVAGREAGVIHNEQGFSVPVDAVVIDEQLPLDADGIVDARSKRMQALVRQCRRRAPELVVALCKRWGELNGDERASAWRLLLRHMTLEANQERRKARELAFTCAAAIKNFRDVRDQRHSLADLLARKGPIEVLEGESFGATKLAIPNIDRPILIVDAAERECLQAHRELRPLDDWQRRLANLRELARAPEVQAPNIHEVAIVHRKAMVAGGLECELWIPRAASPMDAPPELIFTRAGRELGRGRVCESLPCAGIIRGELLTFADGDLELDERQRASFERQLVILYTELATRFANNNVSKADHQRALEYLSWAAAKLETNPLSTHGKHTTALKRALDRVVPPAVRRLVQTTKTEPAPPPATKPEPKLEPIQAEAPKQLPTKASTPEQRLLAAVYEQLHWARSRHRLLDELLLNHLELRSGMPSTELARRDRVLALNRQHPLVARLLAQDPHDPIDLAFLLAALYSFLNYEAEEISDDDERQFVAQLAETLAVAARLPTALAT